jgi:hypothetical protein
MWTNLFRRTLQGLQIFMKFDTPQYFANLLCPITYLFSILIGVIILLILKNPTHPNSKLR